MTSPYRPNLACTPNITAYGSSIFKHAKNARDFSQTSSVMQSHVILLQIISSYETLGLINQPLIFPTSSAAPETPNEAPRSGGIVP